MALVSRVSASSQCGISALWLLPILLGGCTSEPASISPRLPGAAPAMPVRTELNQPADRIADIVAVDDWRDRAKFETVLVGLDDADENVRRAAARQAERLVGKAIPYHSFWPAERRTAAIDAYRRLAALAQQHHKSYLIDLVPVLLDRIETGSAEDRQQTIDDTVLLTGVTFGLRADDTPDVLQARIAMYRQVWALWNQPGNQVLDRKRHPGQALDGK